MCSDDDITPRDTYIMSSDSDDEDQRQDTSGTYKPRVHVPRRLGQRKSARQRDVPAPYIRTSLSPEAPSRAARRAARKRARESQIAARTASSTSASGVSSAAASPPPNNNDANDLGSRSSKRPRTSGPQEMSKHEFIAKLAKFNHKLMLRKSKDISSGERQSEVCASASGSSAAETQSRQRTDGTSSNDGRTADGNLSQVSGSSYQINTGSSSTTTNHQGTYTAPANLEVAYTREKGASSDSSLRAGPAASDPNNGDDVTSSLRELSLEYIDPWMSFGGADTNESLPGGSTPPIRAVTGTPSSTADHAGDVHRDEDVERERSEVNLVTAPGPPRLPSHMHIDRHKSGARFPEGLGKDRRGAHLGSAETPARSREAPESRPPGNTSMAESVHREVAPAWQQPQHGERAAPAQTIPAPASLHRNNGGQLFLAQPSQPSQATNSPAPASAVHQSSVPRQQPQAAAPPGAPVLSREAAGGSAQQPFARAQSGGSDALLGRPRARPRGAGGADTDAPLSRAPPAEPRDDHRAVQARSQTAPPAASRASDGVRGQTGAPRPHARSHASLARHDEVRVPPERVDGSSAAGAEIDAEAAEGGAAPMQADPDAAPENASDALSRIVSTLPVRAAPIQIAAALRGYGLATERDIQAIARWSKFGLETLVEDLKTEGFTKADAITIVEGLRAAAGMVGRTM